MVSNVSSMTTEVKFFAEMNGRILFAECELRPKNSNEFLTGYVCFYCAVRIIDD